MSQKVVRAATLQQSRLQPTLTNTLDYYRQALTAVACVLLVSCGGGGSGGSGIELGEDDPVAPFTEDSNPLVSEVIEEEFDECGVPQLNAWVDASMKDYYLFYDQVPNVNLADFDSPESLIRTLRVQPFDDFSSVTDTNNSVAFFDEGVGFGVGFFWRFDDEGVPRIIFVQDDAPAARAGIRRADIIVAVGGIPWQELDSATFTELTGTRDEPLEARWDMISGLSGEPFSVNMTAAEHNLNTVLHTELLTHPEYDGLLGYLAFSSFIESSEQELQAAFADFRAEGVTDLVLDLRYNGGGRTRIARMLAALIASPGTDDELLIQYQYNDKYQNQNFARFFEPEANGLGLSRVVVLTTGGTASSSEIVINSLRPYIEVVTVGSTTTGKPYISSGRDFCSKRINALEAEGFNAAGVSVFGGIPADCAASDDQTRDFGLASGEIEGMLRAGADYLVFGACESALLAKGNDSAGVFSAKAPTLLNDMMQPLPAEDSNELPRQ